MQALPAETDDVFATHVTAHADVLTRCRSHLAEDVAAVARVLADALGAGGKVIAFGNGGSAAQASHFAGELLGRFAATRRPLPALALPADSGTVTCIGNDFGFDQLFARQLQVLAVPGDIAIGFTTSGRSANVLRGLDEARRRQVTTVALTGAAGLDGDADADYHLAVPSDDTALIQEMHLLIVHAWCRWIDRAFPPATGA